MSSYLKYLDENNLYGWTMSQKPLVNGFEWVKKLSKFNEKIIKNYDEKVINDILLMQMLNYPKKLFNLHKDLPFLPERKKRK